MKSDFMVADNTIMLRAIGVMEKVLEKTRRNENKTKADVMFNEFVLDQMRTSVTAKQEGKFLVGTTVLIPTEIFYAMDITPIYLDLITSTPAMILNRHDEYFAASRAFGLSSEICSVHRVMAAPFILGEAPPFDAVVWSSIACDITAKSGDIPLHVYGVPGFFLDRPFGSGEHHVKYFSRELEELVGFLENLTHRKLDPDRLREAMVHSKRSMELFREITELKKAVPSPLPNRRVSQMTFADICLPGDPRLVEFLETIRDEAKANVDKGIGAIADEQYRVMTFFFPPSSSDVLEWMEEEYGVSDVTNPHYDYYAEGSIDIDKPFESLSRKVFYRNIVRHMAEPFAKAVLPDMIECAREYKAEGLIFWAHCACRTIGPWTRMLKDELAKEVGIPTLVVDHDMQDESYVSSDLIQSKLESFFELLDERK